MPLNWHTNEADTGLHQMNGTLYIVSTPIGNLEDVTFRALRILRDVDLIAAENVNHSKKICRHYGITTRLTSYNQHNRKQKGPGLIRHLKSGMNIALVTNAGTPAVSDPGNLLIRDALDEDIKVSPIPGPSAVIAALSVAGMKVDQFVFMGFLSSRASKRRKELATVIHESRTMVFFEAPHRLIAMLNDLQEILGDRPIVILRELTKVYEETKRGLVSTLVAKLQQENLRGEYTLVVSGEGDEEEKGLLDKGTRKKIENMLKGKRGGVREIATRISGRYGLPYRTVYKECLALKKTLEG